jgi:hypothetical protein
MEQHGRRKITNTMGSMRQAMLMLMPMLNPH